MLATAEKRGMNYCPQCGREVLADDVHVCYHCKEPLTENAPSVLAGNLPDDVDQELFWTGFTALLDNEIASITSSVTPDAQLGAERKSEEKLEVRRQVNHVRHHTIGYGKGLIKMMLLEAEAGNPEVSYDSEDYELAYRWVRETVDERREYIRDALQAGDEDGT